MRNRSRHGQGDLLPRAVSVATAIKGRRLRAAARSTLRPALLLAFLVPGAAAAAPDPAGDTFGRGAVQVDLVETRATIGGGRLTIELLTLPVPAGERPTGLLELDLDDRATSGEPGLSTFLCPAMPVVGAEARVDLFAYRPGDGSAPLLDADEREIGRASVVFGAAAVEVTVPLEALPAPVAAPAFAAVVGPPGEATDCAVDRVGSSLHEIPTLGPAAMSLLALALAAAAAAALRRPAPPRGAER